MTDISATMHMHATITATANVCAKIAETLPNEIQFWTDIARDAYTKGRVDAAKEIRDEFSKGIPWI